VKGALHSYKTNFNVIREKENEGTAALNSLIKENKGKK